MPAAMIEENGVNGIKGINGNGINGYHSEEEEGAVDKVSIRDAIVAFLNKTCLPYTSPFPMDMQFFNDCVEDSVRRGCHASGPFSLAPHLPGGVLMALHGYGHLKNKHIKIMIAIYTGCGIYLDDVYQKDINRMRYFNERFIQRVPQADPVLDCFATILREFSDYFERVVANIMVTSTLNAVNALLLEYETQGMTLNRMAVGYPTFARVMSGASEAYTLFIFPREIVLPNFIQTLHQIMIFINNGNDILSLYKEESDGETVNRISFLATLKNYSKYDALWELTEEVIRAYTRAVECLQCDERALACFLSFAKGYIAFHTALPRYKIDDLGVKQLLRKECLVD